MTPDELMAEACRLAAESVDSGLGGPFGAVIARDGEIVARGQNLVLATGDPTEHAEMVAIRKAATALGATRFGPPDLRPVSDNDPGHAMPGGEMPGNEMWGNATPGNDRWTTWSTTGPPVPEPSEVVPTPLFPQTLALVPRPAGSDDPVPERARMLMGMEIYASGAPCPMCMSAIYWARLDAVHFASDWEAARSVGFDDAFQYEDFERPLDERRIPIAQFRPDLGRPPLDAWANRADRRHY